MGETTLSFYLPFEIVDDGEYQVSIEGREASLNIKREQRCNEDFEKLSGFAVEGTGSVTITRDPWGISGFTRVVVRIPRYVPFEECRLEAQRYLNRLIQVWRFFTRYHWLPYVADDAILSFERSIQEAKRKSEAIFGFGVFNKFFYPSRTIEPNRVIASIRAGLSDELRIPIHEELRLTARDHFDKGQFNLAVIEMNIAFESLTAEILRSRLKETGLSDRDVEKRMDRYLPSSMHQLLDKVLKEVDGRSLRTESHLWKKFERARLVRKNSVHPYIRDLQAGEAAEALFALEEIMQWLAQPWKT